MSLSSIVSASLDAPRCVRIHTIATRWGARSKALLVATLGGVCFGFLFFLAFGLDMKGSAILTVAVSTPVALLFLIVLLVDFIRHHRSMARLRSDITSTEHVGDVSITGRTRTRVLSLQTTRRRGHLPERYIREFGEPEAAAVMLTHASSAHLPTPLSSNIFFEPIQIPGDFRRLVDILNTWILPNAKDITNQTPLDKHADGPRKAKRLLRDTIALMLGYVVLIALLSRISPYRTGLLLAGTLPFVGLWAFIRFWYMGFQSLIIYPSSIILYTTRQRGHARRINRERRALWYDATQSTVFIPIGETGFHAVKTTYLSGLVMLWSWVNTSPTPTPEWI